MVGWQLARVSRVACVVWIAAVAGLGCAKRSVEMSPVNSLPVTDPLIVNDVPVNPARLDSLLELLTMSAPRDTVSLEIVPSAPAVDSPATANPTAPTGTTGATDATDATDTADTADTTNTTDTAVAGAADRPAKEAPPTGTESIAPVRYDIPVEFNVRVLTWVDSYSGSQKAWFARALKRSGRWLPMIQEIFRDEGLPSDLAFMALVESGYRHNARSRVSAIGMWQFMRDTAREMGLRVDTIVDERLDPERSTRAAARYLKKLHGSFGDWHLAMAAYNTGAGNVRRAIRRSGSRDFWEIARSGSLARETRNFVPAIMAATILAHEPDKFGFSHVTRDDPLDSEWVEVTSPTHLDIIARVCGVPGAVIRSLNPGLIQLHTPHVKGGYRVRVPVGTGDGFGSALAQIPEAERMLHLRHKVRSGESLSVLASRYGTSIRAIQDANRLGRRTTIRTGTTLVIPTGSGGGASSLRASAPTHHRVRPGETLSHLASAYGTSVKTLQELNRIQDPHDVRSGQRLLVRAGRGGAPPDASPPSTYRVTSGESLWTIARKHGVSVDALRRANPNVRGNTIRSGQRLSLPPGATVSSGARDPIVHRVRRGENLWDIAKSYGTSISNLRSWNGLDAKQSIIRPGDRLKVYR